MCKTTAAVWGYGRAQLGQTGAATKAAAWAGGARTHVPVDVQVYSTGSPKWGGQGGILSGVGPSQQKIHLSLTHREGVFFFSLVFRCLPKLPKKEGTQTKVESRFN